MERQAAYIIAKAITALISAIGMHAENMQRAHRGESIAYDSLSFEQLIVEQGISENQIIQTLNGVYPHA